MSPDGRLSVLVVGCGNIAGGFDAARPDDAAPLTHAGALRQHGGFVLQACVDPDAARRAAFAARWGLPQAAASIDALQAAPGSFDLVCICSPTALHAEHLEAALALAPRLVFCEKPVTPTLAETALWAGRYAEAGIPLAINHTRRWAPDVERLAAELRRGDWGALRSAGGLYNKGVLNNGGHMVDLLQLLLGPVQPLAAGLPLWDFWPEDPSVPALLQTADGVPVTLHLGHAADCAVFELQLVTERAVITMEDGGQAWRVRPVVESPSFKGYRSLAAGERRAGEYALAMRRAAANLHAAATQGQALASTADSARTAQAVCEALRRMALDRASAKIPPSATETTR